MTEHPLIPFLRARYDEAEQTAWRQHIPLNDPAFVLADIAAKQRILARCEYRLSMQPDNTQGPDDWDELTRHYFEVIRDLAEPFASHPDYPKDQP